MKVDTRVAVRGGIRGDTARGNTRIAVRVAVVVVATQLLLRGFAGRHTVRVTTLTRWGLRHRGGSSIDRDAPSVTQGRATSRVKRNLPHLVP